MEFSAKQIADILHGKIEGNENTIVNNFSKIEEGKPGTLTFLGNPKYGCYIYDTQASVALVNDDFVPEKELPSSLTLIRVKDAYAALSVLFNLVAQAKPQKKGIDPLSFISSTAKLKSEEIYVGAFAYIGENVSIGKNVSIYPQAYIGDNANIDDDTIIYSGVKIYDSCRVGKRCILHSGTVIGADGFGFAKEGDTYKKIPQLGNVVIEDDVEIGANTAIDRAAMESTIIRKGVKLDNLVHIAHNVEIGENTALTGQVGIAGSAKIGKNCVFGGQAGVGGHIKIEDNVSVGAQAGIISNIKQGRTVMGSPVTDLQTFLRSSIIFPKLPDMYRTLNQLRKEVNELKKELNNKQS